MPVFTLSFCALIIVIYILDAFVLVPENAGITAKERFLTGHNKGLINRALHLSDEKIRRGEVWRLVSSALLHVGTPHIITNTLAMLIVGYAVESQLGALRTLVCYAVSALVSGLFMAFIYKLHEGEGASPGIFGLIAVFIILAVKNGTLFFSPLPLWALIILGIYVITGFFGGKATLCEHLSGFAGGLLTGLAVIFLM
ncbi:MAG: rhomboid family intramembrane serine protease [Clostridia bacterium]|nr:rhomboid family intramembrane serine protease [Clostridia bacterium]